MVEMELNKIIIDEKHHDQVIVLREKNGRRILPIVIGFMEASSIKMTLSGIRPPRPLTHDLMYSILENLQVNIDRVIIDKLQDNTFHAKLILRMNGTIKSVDARPSDCLALCVRTKSPIFVEDEVLERSANQNKPL